MSALEGLLAGAHGWISGILNLLPAQAVQLYQAACLDKDVDAARAAWNRILPFVHLYTHQDLGLVNDLAIYRAGLEIMGEHGGHSRPPFYPLTDEQKVIVRRRLEAADLLA
jgi:4-hydroxy-tetrahydrodipicolinate synthase